MKLKLLTTFMALTTAFCSNAQCLNGGCDVGMSREAIQNGVFVGHYENGEKTGLGINYLFNPTGSSAKYSDYYNDKPKGVMYSRDENKNEETVVHTFENYQNGSIIYPAIRVTKIKNKTKIQVAFKEGEWKKYEGDQTVGDLHVKNVLFDGSPAFVAINGTNQVLALSATISSIDLLSSDVNELYYNPLQLNIKDNRMMVNIFPKAGANTTELRTSLDWDVNNPSEGIWFYKRYFNDELTYRYDYEEILELPSALDIKQQKLEKAFNFVAQQVEEYDFEKGYEGKAQDFADIITDIKARAESKGLTASSTYDITMTKLSLLMGNKMKALKFAQSACEKKPAMYNKVTALIEGDFPQHSDILPMLKAEERLAASGGDE